MISIIIIVKNNIGIENTIERLIKIPKAEETEIIVIDASEGKLDYIKKKFPDVAWFYYSSDSKEVTIAEQRNIGIERSKGRIIVFIDADCIPGENWLIELARPIIEEDETVVVGSIKTIGKKNIWDVEDLKRYSNIYLDEASTANLAFKREVVEKIGFFDENFDYGSDADFTWRISKNGYKIRYNKDAIIHHEWGSFGLGIKRALRYGESRPRLYKKHPYRWKNLFGSDIVTLFYPLYIILFPLIFFLILVPIIKNIKRQPLKVVFINLVYGYGVLKGLFTLNKWSHEIV